MADSLAHGEKPIVDSEGASGVSHVTEQEDASRHAVAIEVGGSSSPTMAADKADACEEATASGFEGQSPSKNKKVSFHPTPIVISESDKDWGNSGSEPQSSDSSSSAVASGRPSPSAQLTALHIQSRRLLEEEGPRDFTSDEFSGDSETSDLSDVQPEVSSDELERMKTHNLCRGKEELRESDIENLRRSFSFAKSKLEACLRRTMVRSNKEMSAFENMTKDLLSSFRELFVILCIRSPVEERNYKKFIDMATNLVATISAKSLGAFNRVFAQSDPSGAENAIKSWYSSAKLAVLKELSDMEKAETATGQPSTKDSDSASGSASN